MSRIGVIHLIDTLEVGGAELMAVNLVNHLPEYRYHPYLCTTRRGGSLLGRVGPHVTYLNLARRNRFDLSALKRLVDFIREHDIRVIHAHGPALFIAKAAALCLPGRILVWHAHYGGLTSQNNRARFFRLASSGATVITVNEELAEWARHRLCVPAHHVHYLRNFAVDVDGCGPAPDLPGSEGFRIVSVANIRAEKDYLTLIQAFAKVVSKFPRMHLLLVGGASDLEYFGFVVDLVERLGLAENVSFLGPRDDIYSILKGCDVGVISSTTEGLPMALLEYGTVGLPTVSTRVGQCAQVVNNGDAGLLVEPRSPEALAHALEYLIASPERRRLLGAALQVHIERHYSAKTIVSELCQIYENLVSRAGFEPPPTASKNGKTLETTIPHEEPFAEFVAQGMDPKGRS